MTTWFDLEIIFLRRENLEGWKRWERWVSEKISVCMAERYFTLILD